MGGAEQVLLGAPVGSRYRRYLNRRSASCLVSASFILQFVILLWLKNSDANSGRSNSLEKSKILWTSCGANLECGRLEAPLDYSNISSPSVSIYVTRYLATKRTSRLGSIFVNPGGPGGSGAALVFGAGEQLSKIMDGKYDIVGWDPRGVGGTRPRFECFDSQTKTSSTPTPTRYFQCSRETCPIPLSLPLLKRGLASRTDEVLPFHVYARKGPEKYIDTIIGSYLVNLFPELVGRVIIDGVVDPHMWANIPPHKWPKADLDPEKALANFFNTCVMAGPQRCALAHNTSTSRSVASAVDKLLKDLHKHPLPVPHAARPGVLTASMVQSLMYGSLSRPRSWPAFAHLLSSAIKGNGEPILNAMAQNVELDPSKPARTEYAPLAIICADSVGYDGADKDALFDEMMATPKCLNKTERIGAPSTPLAFARKVNEYLNDSSRLVIQDGSGHCSIAMASLCTIKIIRDYFLHGKLPQNGVICPVDEILFPPSSGSADQLNVPREGISDEDKMLLKNVQELGDVVIPFSPFRPW
ncbi:hypothetical protein BD410DRAFT_841140 [Rickenella mellea]|uniref:Peptidase S33 tripeptidyl aminopeptidase-like C-terminal domain-containing protein n=1 Tax=Rickenella mellea TaxID=50990 RepID=A0A4Y7Q065_9AGAM|nr:hypothetical protein BD410DRAFT_841140 [Rickenella mellea]